MGDIGDVWNEVKDTFTLFESGQSVQMGGRAFACPSGAHPGDLDWAKAGEQTVGDELEWTNWVKEHLGLSSGSKVRFGVTWNYGGTSPQHPGLYLHDAYLWGLVDYSTAGTDFTITGGFGDAVPVGNSAELSGWIRIDKKQF
jgi:hypothetical protein